MKTLIQPSSSHLVAVSCTRWRFISQHVRTPLRRIKDIAVERDVARSSGRSLQTVITTPPPSGHLPSNPRPPNNLPPRGISQSRLLLLITHGPRKRSSCLEKWDRSGAGGSAAAAAGACLWNTAWLKVLNCLGRQKTDGSEVLELNFTSTRSRIIPKLFASFESGLPFAWPQFSPRFHEPFSTGSSANSLPSDNSSQGNAAEPVWKTDPLIFLTGLFGVRI